MQTIENAKATKYLRTAQNFQEQLRYVRYIDTVKHTLIAYKQ